MGRVLFRAPLKAPVRRRGLLDMPGADPLNSGRSGAGSRKDSGLPARRGAARIGTRVLCGGIAAASWPGHALAQQDGMIRFFDRISLATTDVVQLALFLGI